MNDKLPSYDDDKYYFFEEVLMLGLSAVGLAIIGYAAFMYLSGGMK